MNVLQSLVQLYEDLSAKGLVSPFGWSPVKISYLLDINSDGELNSASCVLEEVTNTKGKTYFKPQVFEYPASVARSSGFCPNFLWDNATYALGIDAKGKADRAIGSFKSFKEFHHRLLDEVNTPNAVALLRFLDKWSPLDAAEHPVLKEIYDGLLGGSNLTFTVNGELLTDDISIQHAWDTYYRETDGPQAQCLVTGEWGPAMLVHPAIKKLDGAQSTGAKLVSFNEPSFNSYGHTQGENAPVSQYAAFAYTTALNYLLENRVQTAKLGETTVAYWTIGLEQEREDAVYAALKDAFAGKLVKDVDNDMLDSEIFVLGISPNVSRIHVKFFYETTLRKLMKNVEAHHARMDIQRPAFDQYEEVPLWLLFDNLVRPGGDLAERTKRAIVQTILTGAPYPHTMPANALLRIRAEKKVSRARAAALKAYYLQNPTPECPEEVLTVALNEFSENIPYNLGRLFSVYEAVQEIAIGNLNTSIKDRYFNAAMSCPAAAFTPLTKLYTAHIRKIEKKMKFDSTCRWAFYNYAPMVERILALLPEQFPEHFTAAEQSSFSLGYYHQTQKRFEKKNNGSGENPESNNI